MKLKELASNVGAIIVIVGVLAIVVLLGVGIMQAQDRQSSYKAGREAGLAEGRSVMFGPAYESGQRDGAREGWDRALTFARDIGCFEKVVRHNIYYQSVPDSTHIRRGVAIESRSGAVNYKRGKIVRMLMPCDCEYWYRRDSAVRFDTTGWGVMSDSLGNR